MADDLNRPYVGYRSAGRRPESQQDRRASADAPLAALRGLVSGVLGAPGDVESLVRMLPGLSEQTVLPTSEDVERRLPLRAVSETPVGRVATGVGQLGGGFYTGPGSPLRAVAALPSAVRRAARDFAVAAGQPAVNVIKPKGGNWLQGSIEREIEPMRVRERTPGINFHTEEQAASDVALNKWLDKKLRTYIRNEMATPEDPLRALAERGVLHYEMPGLNTYNLDALEQARQTAGFPAQGMATTRLGREWEAATDRALYPSEAGYLARTKEVDTNPFLLKVPPETMVYEIGPRGGEFQSLGFGHLVDELRNAINPESGLPRELLWKYSDLDKVTVPQAVERVAKINEWRAAQKAEADLMRAQNAATQVFKEYPEQGFRWVELKAPAVDKNKLPAVDDPKFNHWAGQEGFDFDEPGALEEARHLYATRKTGGDKALEDALKYEGEVMGHCVGSYCDDVAYGSSRIFSLRDKKGQPHVTIEVRPSRVSPSEFYHGDNVPESLLRKLDEAERSGAEFDWEKIVRESPEYKALPGEIVQIKGSGKKDPGQKIRHAGTGYKDNPDAHLLPMVHDFVRSQKWERVGDLENTGLYRADPDELGMFVPSDPRLKNLPGRRTEVFQRAKEAGLFGDQEYLTRAEWEDILRKQVESESGPLPPLPEEGFSAGGLVGLHQRYADGGAVRPAPQSAVVPYDEAKIDALANALTA